MIDYIEALLNKDYGLKPREKDVLLAILVQCSKMGTSYTTASNSRVGELAGIRVDHAGQAIERLVERNILIRGSLPSGEKAIAIQPLEQWKTTQIGENMTQIGDTQFRDTQFGDTQIGLFMTQIGEKSTQIGDTQIGEKSTQIGDKHTQTREKSTQIGDPILHGDHGEHDHVTNHDLSSPSPRSHDHARVHAHAHETTTTLAPSTNNLGLTSPESLPGASTTSAPVPGGSLTPPWDTPAFPGELDWVLDAFKVKSIPELEVGRASRNLNIFRRWYGFSPEIRAEAYLSYDEMRSRKNIARPVEYAIEIACSLLNDAEGRQNGNQSSKPAGKSRRGPQRDGPPGGHRDWDAEFGGA